MSFIISRGYVEVQILKGERGGSVVECRTLEREVGGSKPTATVWYILIKFCIPITIDVI